MFVATLSLRLVRFTEDHAATIASWVHDDEQLAWLSPGTLPPLTAEKVRHWPRPDGAAFVLVTDGDGETNSAPLGYGELNRMRSGKGNWWIGHLIVHPRRRREGLGRSLLSMLLDEAFETLAANCICLVVFPDNLAAIKCYESAGFKRVGMEYHRFAQRGPRTKLARFEIQRNTWQNRRQGC